MVIIPSNYLTKVKASTLKLFSTKGSKDTLATQRNCYNTTLQEFIDKEVRGVWAYTESDWNNVQAEYVDLLSDDRLDDLFLLKRDINKLHNKIQLTQQCITALELMYYEPICGELNKLGFKIKFTRETLDDDLKRVVTLAQALVLQRDEKVKLYKAAESKLTGNGKKITEQDYDDNLVTLSKFQGYRIGKEVFLAEYIAVKNAFSEHVKITNEKWQ